MDSGDIHKTTKNIETKTDFVFVYEYVAQSTDVQTVLYLFFVRSLRGDRGVFREKDFQDLGQDLRFVQISDNPLPAVALKLEATRSQ